MKCKKPQIGYLMNLETKSMNNRNTLPRRLKLKKEKQIEILKLKNLIKEMKNELASVGNRADQIGERISDIEDRNLEMM